MMKSNTDLREIAKGYEGGAPAKKRTGASFAAMHPVRR